MASRLVNVRLDEARRRKVRKLRQRGVVLSDLVRRAVDERFAELGRSAKPTSLEDTMKEIFERYPDPPDLRPASYDVRDRKEARRAILRRLATRR